MNPLITDPVAYYNKRFKFLKVSLEKLEYYRALDCIAYATIYHKGTRKDNITPEFCHQVDQCLYLMTIRKLLLFPEDSICATILHDTVEDYHEAGASHAHVYEKAGERVSNAVRALTNNTSGIAKPDTLYYAEMAQDSIASIVKCGDWANNLGSMLQVYKAEKIQQKIDKANTYLFPMIKTARGNFPRQEDAYQNVQTMLVFQVRMLESLTGSGYENEEPKEG